MTTKPTKVQSVAHLRALVKAGTHSYALALNDFYSQGGHNGYLRGGNPFSEAVDNMTTEKNGVGAAQIPEQRLRTLLAQESKECLDYPEWEAFVECCEQREQETGEPVTIFISY